MCLLLMYKTTGPPVPVLQQPNLSISPFQSATLAQTNCPVESIDVLFQLMDASGSSLKKTVRKATRVQFSKLISCSFLNKNKTGGLGWWFGVGGKAMFFW